MFENITNFLKKISNKEHRKASSSKETAKERLQLVLVQDRANVSVDFLELMKQEIIEVIKKYIQVDESAIDVRLTNKENADGTSGAPALYASIPIVNLKNEEIKEVKDQIKKSENTQKEENTNTDNKISEEVEEKIEVTDKKEIVETEKKVKDKKIDKKASGKVKEIENKNTPNKEKIKTNK